MSLKVKISEDMKNAMRNKDSERLGAIRLLQSALKQKEVDERIEIGDGGHTHNYRKNAKTEKRFN